MKVDFHCHTKSVKQGETEKRNIDSKRFAEIMNDANVKIVAITNHNEFDKEQYKEFIKEVMISLGYKGEDIVQDILSYAFDCDALIAMLPVQDLLGYGKEARVNLPGTVGSYNWSYRLTSFDDYKKKLKDIKKMIDKSKR